MRKRIAHSETSHRPTAALRIPLEKSQKRRILATLAAAMPSASALAAEGAGSGPSPWFVFAGIITVMALGLYLQSNKKRMA